jgi:hypothetical protein
MSLIEKMKKVCGVIKELCIEVCKQLQELEKNAKHGIHLSHMNQISTQLIILMQDLSTTTVEIQMALEKLFGAILQMNKQDGITVAQFINS